MRHTVHINKFQECALQGVELRSPRRVAYISSNVAWPLRLFRYVKKLSTWILSGHCPWATTKTTCNYPPMSQSHSWFICGHAHGVWFIRYQISREWHSPLLCNQASLRCYWILPSLVTLILPHTLGRPLLYIAFMCQPWFLFQF